MKTSINNIYEEEGRRFLPNNEQAIEPPTTPAPGIHANNTANQIPVAAIKAIFEEAQSMRDCQLRLLQIDIKLDIRGTKVRVQNMRTGRVRRLGTLGILPEFVQMMARIYGGEGCQDLTKDELKELDLDLRFISGTEYQEEIPEERRAEVRKIIREIPDWRLKDALEMALREETDDHVSSLMEQLRKHHENYRRYLARQQTRPEADQGEIR